MKKTKSNKHLLFVGIFLASFLLCISFTSVYIGNKIKLNYTEMEHLAYTRATKVSNVITNLLYKTQVLSALVIQQNGVIEDFDRVASSILDSPAIRNVIAAPDGVVSHVYPLEGNEALLGFDFFSSSAGNREALLAKESGELVLGGPFTLIQGGQALVGRLPVYLTDEHDKKYFWGLVSVTLNYPDALADAELDQLKEQGYAYELWRTNPDNNEKQIIASSSYSYNKDSRFVEYSFNILNAEWIFRIAPIKEWYQFPETWLFLFAGLVISLLISLLFKHNACLRQMHKELENLTTIDFLTGLINRRGIFTILNNMVLNPNSPFILCYMDIDKFKLINDTYGHSTGDKVLQDFTQTLLRNADSGHLLGRIGGDEFILVIPETDDPAIARKFFNTIKTTLDHEYCIAGNIKSSISFSVGCAVFPSDGSTIDDLLETADHKMYEQKGNS